MPYRPGGLPPSKFGVDGEYNKNHWSIYERPMDWHDQPEHTMFCKAANFTNTFEI